MLRRMLIFVALMFLCTSGVVTALEQRSPHFYLWQYFYLPSPSRTGAPLPRSTTAYTDLNDAGDVVAQQATTSLFSSVIIHMGGLVTPLRCPGGGFLSEVAINYRADAVGTCRINNQQIGVLLRERRGTYEEQARVLVPGSAATLPKGINDHRHMVGIYYDAQFNGPYPFFATQNRVIPWGEFGMAPQAISNGGWIFGFRFIEDGNGESHIEGFVSNLRDVWPFTVPGATDTVLMDGNERGELVGTYGAEDGSAHSFYAGGGQVLDIMSPDPHVLFTEVTSINNHAQLAGRVIMANVGTNPDIPIQLGFIATPLPAGILPAPATAEAETASQSQALVAATSTPHPQVTLNTTSCAEGYDVETGSYQVVPLALRQQLGCTD